MLSHVWSNKNQKSEMSLLEAQELGLNRGLGEGGGAKSAMAKWIGSPIHSGIAPFPPPPPSMLYWVVVLELVFS